MTECRNGEFVRKTGDDVKIANIVRTVILAFAVTFVCCFCCMRAENNSVYTSGTVHTDNADKSYRYSAVGTEMIDGKVNIASASAETLDTLDGIGSVLAMRIIDARIEEPFRTIEDIMKVSGIGNAKFGKIKDRITIENNDGTGK